MLYIQHWKFKHGCHQKNAAKFLATGSLEGWILGKRQDRNGLYEHTDEWAEYLDYEITPVFNDVEAGPICEKFMVNPKANQLHLIVN